MAAKRLPSCGGIIESKLGWWHAWKLGLLACYGMLWHTACTCPPMAPSYAHRCARARVCGGGVCVCVGGGAPCRSEALVCTQQHTHKHVLCSVYSHNHTRRYPHTSCACTHARTHTHTRTPRCGPGPAGGGGVAEPRVHGGGLQGAQRQRGG